MSNSIKIVGAKEHNLKSITVEIPKGKLVVITGPSGSGKSSLALDTIYSEGKRRYVESLSAYARQFWALQSGLMSSELMGFVRRLRSIKRR